MSRIQSSQLRCTGFDLDAVHLSIRNLLYRRGGLARTTEILELGRSRSEIDLELAQGRIIRPIRGWLAHPTADRELLLAARHHVVLNCVTQAQRLGLWVRESPGVAHVAAPHQDARSPRVRLVMHWARPWILRPPFALVDPIENVLQCVAACQPRESALVIWESAMNKRLIDRARLSTLPLSQEARSLLERCTPYSDSGLESLVVERLRWLSVEVRQQIHLHGHRVDVLIGARLVVQIDGATHTGDQRDIDNRHDAELRQMGCRVLRVGYHQVMQQWEQVQGLILAAIARGEHLARR